MDEEAISAMNGISALNFSPGYLLGSFVFGVIGFYMFRAGKKRINIKTTYCGIALMVYPVFISDTWLTWIIGAILTGLGYHYLKNQD